MRIRKRTLFLLTILGVLLAMIFGVIQWQLPKVKAFAKFYIESISSDDKVPVKIEPGQIDVSLLPPRLILKDIKITPKKDLAKTLKPLEIGAIEVDPSLLDLIIGKFWISTLSVKNTFIEAYIEAPKKGGQSKPPDLGKILKSIPISEILLQNITAKVNYQNQYTVTNEGLYIRAYNQKNNLLAKIKEPNLMVTKAGKEEGINFLLDTQFMLTKNSLSISKLKVVKDKSYFIASGAMRFPPDFSKVRELRMNTRVKANIPDLHKWSNYFYKNDHVADLDGEIRLDINLDQATTRPLSASVIGGVEGLKVGKLFLGNITVEGSAKDETFFDIPKLVVDLPGGQIVLSNAKVKNQDSVEFSTDLSIKSFQLKDFLKGSNIADIPVWLKTKGDLKCTGSYKKTLKVVCPGKMFAQNLLVKSKSKKTIVSFEKMNMEGSTTITEKGIAYDAQLSTDRSKGSSKGFIDFEKGFDIAYEASLLDFEDIGEISELPFGGQLQLKGSTQGTSAWAVFNMDIKSTGLEFTDYFFGDMNATMSYKSGTIFLKNIDGNLESTRYNGLIEIDLLQERLRGDLTLPFFRMTDIQQSIVKKVDLQGRFTGSGSGKLSLNTPFETDKMSFNFKSRLFKGTAFDENYDEAQLHLVATDGIIDVKKGRLIKEKTNFDLAGTLNTKLDADFRFTVQNGDFQTSKILKNFKVPVLGYFTASGKVYGKLDKPQMVVSADINEFTFNKKLYGKANFTYADTEANSTIQFGIPKKLKMKLRLPQKEGQNILVDGESTDLDIAPVVGFAIAEQATSNYVIQATGEMTGQLNVKDPWSSEFSSVMKKLVVDYKGNQLESKFPTNLELKGGKIFFNDFVMEGKNQFVKVSQPHSLKYETKLIIQGRINISFFKIFAPFIERIDGFSTVRLELNLYKDKVKLIGSSFTSDAYIKFPKFPHAFENVTADILFNQNKLLINSIKGRFADGTALGNGEMLFLGPKDFKLAINMSLEKVNMAFPEGVNTQGNAQLKFEGTGIPYKLTGNYKVDRGLVSMELDAGSGGGQSTTLLTDLLKKEESSPIALDIFVDASNGMVMKNTLVDGIVYGKLRVFDTIDTVRLKGNAQLSRRTQIEFRDTEFEVTESNFQFNGNFPINPNLFLNAKARISPYDVNILLQGTSKVPKFELTSQPALTEKEIVSLLVLGHTGGGNESGSSTQSVAQSGLEIGTALFTDNPLGKELKDRFGWDVQVVPSIDDETSALTPRATMRKKLGKNSEVMVSRQEGTTTRTEANLTYELSDSVSAILSFKQQRREEQIIREQNRSEQIGVDLEYNVEFK